MSYPMPWSRSFAVMCACAIVASWGGSGCHGGSLAGDLAAPCDRDRDCRAPYVCEYARCRARCVRDADCDDGQCVPALEPASAPVCLPEEPCVEGECPRGLRCDSDELCQFVPSDAGAGEDPEPDAGAGDLVPDSVRPTQRDDAGAMRAPDAAVDAGGRLDAATDHRGEGLRDGAFGDPSAWTTALLDFDPDYFGPGDGLVAFDVIGLCGGSWIGQTYDLAAASHPDPMVFSIEYFGEALDTCFAPVALVLDGVPQPIHMPHMNGTARVCLGERAYGSGIELELRAMSTMFCPEMSYCHPRTLGGIALEPAQPGECAELGSFVNPDFSDDSRGWRFEHDQVIRPGQDGELILEHHMCGPSLLAQTNVSIPLRATLPNPAIRFDVRFEPGPEPQLMMRQPAVKIGFDVFNGTFERQVDVPMSQTTTVTTCVPSFALGTSQTFFVSGFDSLAGCRVDDPVLLYTMSLARFELVSDAACAVPMPELAIDGVERQKSAWFFEVMEAGWLRSNDGAIDIVTDAANARSGSQVLKLDSRNGGCSIMSARTRAVVPKPAGGLKPALSFWHRVDDAGTDFLARTYPFGGIDRTFHAGPGWQREEYCIDDTHYGQLLPMAWELLTMGESCNELSTPVTLWIDDIAFVLSDACP